MPREMISGILYGLMGILLLAIALLDIKKKEIDGRLLVLLLLASLPAVALNEGLSYVQAYGAAVGMWSFLMLLYFISNKNIGLGDVKLCAAITPYLGIERAFTMLLLAMVLCGVYGILLLLLGKVKKDKELPFAPFAAMATAMALWI
jgi:leader peptidase (prepilin peptidase)/N-methyltransferase